MTHSFGSTSYRAAILISWMLPLLPAAAVGTELPPPHAEPVDFSREVRPILARACFSCHGAEKQESGLRLDRRAAAMKGGDFGVAIVPGKSGESPLIRLVAGVDKDAKMPPEGDRLSAAEIGILRRWIDDGAVWPNDNRETLAADGKVWWSLRPLVRTAVPEVNAAGAGENPIDAFVQARLAAAGLSPSPRADRATLIRRLSFDLLGLPPTPEEVADFVADPRPDAYEQLVDRLLASPRHGERWARHWLDVVHFAETHGHDQDRPRENAWPYRDYVIAAFNADKPFARFVQEQIAADALFPDQTELTPALGLLAAGPWDESSLRDIREDTLDRQIARYLDRDDIVTTVMSAFASSTVHCARCHQHKFDPISQADYYSLQAVFAGVEKAEKLFDGDPRVHARRRELLRDKLALERRDEAAIERLLTSDLRLAIETWETSLSAAATQWTVLAPQTFTVAKATELKRLDDDSLLATGSRPEDDIYTITAETDLSGITAVRLEVLTDDSLPQRGPGRQDNGNLHLTEFRVQDFAGKSLPLKNPTADFDQAGWDIAKAIDGNPQTAWGIHPEVGKPHVAVFEFAAPVAKEGGSRLTFILEQQHGRMHTIGRCRLSVTNRPPPIRVSIPPALAAILAKPQNQRTATDERELAVKFLLEQIGLELGSLPPPQRVYAGTRDFLPNGSQQPVAQPRPVHVLRRGEITRPGDLALPGALSCVAELSARFELADADDEAARRAALASWLTDPKNPLTWRSIANRVWHYHFGRGLVDSPNDFGRMGSPPSHPELLDWLAVTLRDGGGSGAETFGSLKSLHRLIVTSATYQQATLHREDAARLDADNRLLWRMNRQRLDAESVRDSLLVFSDRLDAAMGGPSVKQFNMTPGIHVTPNVDYAGFDVDSPANRRRSIYRFLFRTLPDPLMASLDCPAGDQLAPVRTESVTALQAFTLLNNPFVVRQCEHIAAHIEATRATTLDRVALAFALILHRPPTAEESADFVRYAEQSGLANTCRVLLNSNEFLFVD